MKNGLMYKYWGKADKDGNYHLLVYHCLDVAAVGRVWLEENNTFLKNAAENFCLSEKAFSSWFCFFITLHDIGKFSVTFQNLNPNILELLQNKKGSWRYSTRHDQLGWQIYDTHLFSTINSVVVSSISTDKKHYETRLNNFLNIFARLSFGHHGIPPQNRTSIIDQYFLKDDIAGGEQFVTELLSLFVSKSSMAEFNLFIKADRVQFNEMKKKAMQFSWQLAGLTAMCDWIASGEGFEYYSENICINEYWEKSVVSARRVLQSVGIIPARPHNKGGMKRIFPEFSNSLTPLQSFCDEIKISDKPQLWILEDVTGSGKTEAALTLASRIIAAGLADGCFVALPTMATSNAMYERMADVYHRMFADGEKPSLVLSHGSRHLSDLFRKSYKETLKGLPKNVNINEKEDEGGAHCAQWLADSSKKSLLADVGVGTIDQILLGTLPVRYQSLRVFGMIRKVLIIDEVHAYEPYMLRHLENLLKGHRASGGSAILLSATLPKSAREKFCNIYYDGTEQEGIVELKDQEFPLVTAVAGKTIHEFPFNTKTEFEKRVKIDLTEDENKIHSLISESIKKGNCVCWIRNTISDVNTSFKKLVNAEIAPPDKIEIFHSRFALADRLRIENKIINQFGKDSGQAQRQGRLLIASQVVEQSLDLDFDVMISDLAPIDLLIQRAGRLHRHIRDINGDRVYSDDLKKRSAPAFYVHTPPEPKEPYAKWYSDYFKSAQYVYSDTALLWRTKEIIKQEKAFNMPDNARLLIESVYGDKEIMETPLEVFSQSEDKAWAEVMCARDMADFNKLNFEKGYCTESSNRWEEEERVPTRLSNKQVTLYLCKWENDSITPLYNEEEYPWDMSSLKIREGKIDTIDYPPDIQSHIDVLREQRRFKYDTLFIVFTGGKNTLKGKNKRGKNVTMKYRPKYGLVFE